MKPPKINTKKIQLDKTESSILTITVVATVITIFCLFSVKALIGQAAYQRRVINARHKSTQLLREDIKNANTLITQYNNVFLGSSPENIIGKAVEANNPNPVPPNGNNGQIVLDALPTAYDYPATLTSVSNILTNNGIGSQAISGTDQSTSVNSAPTSNPQPGKIDLTVNGNGSYGSIMNLIKDLERSIRPYDISQLTLNGNQATISATIKMTTYYQPAKNLSITSKEIK